MKALVYEKAENIRLTDAPSPAAAEGETLIEVAAAGICGSDMHAFLGHDPRRPPPLILGHEVCGRADDGAMRIVNPLAVCGECRFCAAARSNLCVRRQIISMPPRPGAFAELVAIPAENLLPLPPQLSAEQGAMTEPLACGHHAAALAIFHCRGDIGECEAAVLGGGAIGLAAALSLSARGAKKVCIVETNPLRRPILQKAGDFEVSPPAPTPSATPADIVIDAVGNDSSRVLAAATVVPGGVVIHIGLGGGERFDFRSLTLSEVAVSGAYTYTAAEFAETARWMSEGKLGALDWFETRPLSEGARAFADLQAGKVAAPKIILMP